MKCLFHHAGSTKKIEADQVFVLEASWGDESEFLKGHIPGSVHINTSAIEEGPIWNRKSDKEIIKALGQHGINKEQKTQKNLGVKQQVMIIFPKPEN